MAKGRIKVKAGPSFNIITSKYQRTVRRLLSNPTFLLLLLAAGTILYRHAHRLGHTMAPKGGHKSSSSSGSASSGLNALGMPTGQLFGANSAPPVTEEPEACAYGDWLEENGSPNITEINANDPNFIFFQKMTRVASTTFSELHANLGEKNTFRFLDAGKKVNSKRRDMDHSPRIVDFLKKRNCPTDESPMMYFDHNVVFDFEEHDLQQPALVTFIRNPVDEFISEYYYCRFGTTGRPQYRTQDCKTMSMKKLKLDPAECRNNYSKYVKNCILPHPLQYIDRLCGLDERCNMGEPTQSHNFQKVMATEVTKTRIMANFYFIGIVEHMHQSLDVLERMAPKFYSGAWEEYSKLDIPNIMNRTSANHKVSSLELDEETLQSLQEIFRYEIDIFKFIERILYEKVQQYSVESAADFEEIKFLHV